MDINNNQLIKKVKKYPIVSKLLKLLFIPTKEKESNNSSIQIKKIAYIPYVGIERNNRIFTKEYENGWPYKLKEKIEKKGMEIGTFDVIRIPEADAIIFFDNMFYKNLPTMWDLYYNNKLDKTVYIDYEPPTGHCKNHSPKGIRMLSKIFKCVITYNDELVNNKNIIKGCISDDFNKEIIKIKPFNEKKFLAMITNNTTTDEIIWVLNYYNNSSYFNRRNIKPHKNELYSRREEAVKYFSKKCPLEFDLYGNNWSEDYDDVKKGKISRSEKIKVISNYKFLISYDSIHNQKGYISEKIFDCFKAKTIPVYWGADNVEDYIPKDCYIDKRDFCTYDDLYNYMLNMTEEEYSKRINSIENYLNSEKYNNLFSSTASANIIYNALLEKQEFDYKQAYKMLKRLQRVKNKVDKYKTILVYSSFDPGIKDTVYMNLCYVNFMDSDPTFFAKKNNQKFDISDFKKSNVNSGEMYVYNFNVQIDKVKNRDKIALYMKDNNKITKLRIRETTPGYHSNLGLKIAKTKLYLIKKFKKEELYESVSYWLKRIYRQKFVPTFKGNKRH